MPPPQPQRHQPMKLKDVFGEDGVFSDRLLMAARDEKWICGDYVIHDEAVQPASIDLRLGDVAYRLRCSFVLVGDSVESKLKNLTDAELNLRDEEGAVLESGRPYLIPLREELALPDGIRARTNPKSSTGRLDVFTRVITDHCSRFDDIRDGYEGRLYLEVVPLSFTVKVKAGLSLNQLRLVTGEPRLSDDELRQHHLQAPLLYMAGKAVDDLPVANGIFLSLALEEAEGRLAGWSARRFAPLIDMGRVNHYDPTRYWQPVVAEPEGGTILEPGAFYLLMSGESVSVPPTLAAEMTAYDPTSGELRTHYAGFFDPGFGFGGDGLRGSRAALEVRAHDVPFLVEDRQRVCKLTFERMLEAPSRLYGSGIGSNYQAQEHALGKHFHVPEQLPLPRPDADDADEQRLFFP